MGLSSASKVLPCRPRLWDHVLLTEKGRAAGCRSEAAGWPKLVPVATVFTREQVVTKCLCVYLYCVPERSLNTEVARATTQDLEFTAWAVPGLAHHCSPGPLPSREEIRERLCSLLGSLNDMYNLSAKTGSVNKDVKPLKHFKLFKSGSLWIECCC